MSSSTDSKGLAKILLANAKIEPRQAIAELYHNSDDADATEVKIYKTEIKNKHWLYIGDNGRGMDMEDMKNYLNLFNVNRNTYDTQKHGKYSFGGKQAIMYLAELKNNNNNENYIIIVTKKRNHYPIACCIKIKDIQNEGWNDTIKAKDSKDDMTGQETVILSWIDKIDDADFSGTFIFIQVTRVNEDLIDNIIGCPEKNIDNSDFIHNMRIDYADRLNECKLWFGRTKDTLHKIDMYDPVYITSDIIDEKYYRQINVGVYRNIEHDRYSYVIDGEYIEYVNKRNHSKNEFTVFEESDEYEKITDFKIEYNMILQVFLDCKCTCNANKCIGSDDCKKKKLERQLRKEEGIYLYRNNIVIGKYPQLGSDKARRTALYEQYTDWTRMKISITADNNLNNEVDKIFGINLNKMDIQWNSLSPILKKTITLYTDSYWGEIKKLMLDLSKPQPQPQPQTLQHIQPLPQPLPRPQPQPQPRPPKRDEKYYRTLLQKREGGTTEVNLGGMRCDVKTDKHVIEIKQWNKRIEGFKVLWYASWYNNDTKIRPRIHIINHNGVRCKHLKVSCQKYGIDLSYEGDNDSIYDVKHDNYDTDIKEISDNTKKLRVVKRHTS